MTVEGFLRWIHDLEHEMHEAHRRFHERWRHHARYSRLIIILNNLKFSAMKSSIKLPTGTPLTGHCSPLDAKGNVLPPSGYKVGSVKYSVANNAGGSPNANYTVAAGATEEDFVVTEVNPGTGGTGTLNQDSQDVNGNPLPTATLDFEFDVVPAVAVDSKIIPDQTSH